MTDWIGRRLGRVQIESLLARGGMAEVYLGTHTTLQRKVAVKILRNRGEEDPRLRLLERFELEARAVAKLRHPNIVQIFDFDTIEDQPYIVMEFVPGPPLSKYLGVLHSNNGRLELPQIARLLNGVASALQYAHEKKVIHRDVKPGNILLTSHSTPIIPGEPLPADFEPVLTDFGLVRLLDSNRQTTIGQTAGTPAYMSPEQAMGLAADGRTDIYSLGIVLYEMLSGKVPFDGESTLSVLYKHLNEAPAPIPGLAPALQAVLDNALAKNADDRFQEPKEFAAAFNTALEDTSLAKTRMRVPPVPEPVKRDRKPASPERRLWWRPALLATALIAIVGASLVFNRMLFASNDVTPTSPPPTIRDTSALQIPVTFGTTATLHFQDGNAIMDRVIVDAEAMPAPPAEGQYEVWLVNGQDRLSLGTLQVDGSGKGQLTFDDPQGRNLLATYHQVEILIQPNASSDANSPDQLAYAYALPEGGISYLQGLMVSFPGLSEKEGLIQGLDGDTKFIDQAGRDMLSDYRSGNEAGAKENAESIMNILVGTQNADHKDWNRDGQATDPGDGYGFFRNGSNLGYIQAVYSYADYAVNSPGASRNMIVNGENVKACSENLAHWAPELRNHVTTILNAPNLSGLAEEIQRSAELADQMLNGVDKNENGQVEPIADECGVAMAYETTYRMADMLLLPVAANALGTPVAVTETVTPPHTVTASSPILVTPTKGPNQSGGQATVAPTQQAPAPTHGQPNPTKKPKPTKNPGPGPNPNPNPKPTKKH